MRVNPCLTLLMISTLLLAPALAAPPDTGRQRPPSRPQADGVWHTLRQIPEACARLQGRFTGQPERPYQLQAVASSTHCRRRAVLLALQQGGEDPGQGWMLDERIMVPSAACPGLAVELRLWRRQPADTSRPRDAQGRERIYLQQAREQWARQRLAGLPQWRAYWQLQGRCG